MKIIVLGASGNIGQEIVKGLEPNHEIIKAGMRTESLLSRTIYGCWYSQIV